MERLMASMKTRHPLKDTHWVGVMTAPQWFGENSKQCGSVRERDGWGLWIKLEEDDTWRVLVVAGGGLATKQLRDGKAQEEAICEHTVWYVNGSEASREDRLQAKDSVKSYRKLEKKETWRGIIVFPYSNNRLIYNIRYGETTKCFTNGSMRWCLLKLN